MAHMELKKKRMLTYFIKSTQDIMTAEGMQGITLRKVADGAGYNNATLYNYFDDLDHVVLYASLKYLSLYNKTIVKELEKCHTAKERFYMMWQIFCQISFAHPDAFHQIFFNKHSTSLTTICDEYYQLFPEELPPAEDVLYPILSDYQLGNRNLLPLRELLTEEKRPLDELDTISELIVSAYHQLLHCCLLEDSRDSAHIPEYTAKMKHYISFILSRSC